MDPGDYIFYEVANSKANKFVFDFKNTTTGNINIYIIKDAKLSKLTVSTVNGDFPSRIYTEIHGTGSSNSGFAFRSPGPGCIIIRQLFMAGKYMGCQWRNFCYKFCCIIRPSDCWRIVECTKIEFG